MKKPAFWHTLPERGLFWLHPRKLPGGVGGEEDDVVGDIGIIGRKRDDVDMGEFALKGFDVAMQKCRLRTLER